MTLYIVLFVGGGVLLAGGLHWVWLARERHKITPNGTSVVVDGLNLHLYAEGEQAPYVLMPHSMSGIEAQLWALTYPEEVAAIVGLDMALPGHYEQMNLGFITACYRLFSAFVRRLGVQRIPLFQKATGVYDKAFLSPAAWQQERYLIHKMTLNPVIYNETAAILGSARKVQRLGIPTIPMLLFVSNGRVAKGWLDTYRAYATAAPNATLCALDCGHMIHNHCAEQIAATTKEYIAKLSIPKQKFGEQTITKSLHSVI